MIPKFSQSGVLPPFLSGSVPTNSSAVAPYKATLLDFVKQFSTSPERKKIILGFLDYRKELKKFGINDGFQWIDGSFVEDIEKIESRAPNDIDLVTFAHRPSAYNDDNKWAQSVIERKDLFLPNLSKKKYLCDAYFVDFKLPPAVLVSRSRYWFGLLSHRRESFIWKGLLEISLSEDEVEATDFMCEGVSDAS